jgi:glycosyltransferase involved in cell wall biosynthesis
MSNSEQRKISVAITCYNSYDYIVDALRVPLIDPRVDEILIIDDASSEGELEKAQDIFSSKTLIGDLYPDEHQSGGFSLHDLEGLIKEKVSAYANDKNMGAYITKTTAVSQCKNEWVFLLDSDNYLLHSSIDALYSTDWLPDTCYYSALQIRVKEDGRSFYDPGLGFHGYTHLGDKPIDMDRFAEIVRKFDSLGTEDWGAGGLGSFLNQGNFFVNKQKYIDTIASIQLRCDPLGFDAGAAMIAWMRRGNNIKVLPGLSYVHRMRSDSLYTSTGEESGHISTHMLANFMDHCCGCETINPAIIFKEDIEK